MTPKVVRSRLARWRAQVPCETVAPLIPSDECHVMVTTRDRNWLASATARVEVQTMTEERSLFLLGVQPDEPGARELVAYLGGLPLALDHARGVMLQKSRKCARFLADLRAVHEAMAGEEGTSEKQLLSVYPPGVLRVFAASLEAVREACQLAPAVADLPRQLAALCGYLDAERIPKRLLLAFLSGALAGCPEETGEEILDAMVRFTMLSRRDEDTFDMHRLVQVAMRAQDAQKAALAELVELMAAQLSFDSRDALHPETQALAPHADVMSVLALRAPSLAASLRLARCLFVLGEWYDHSGRYAEVRVCRCLCSFACVCVCMCVCVCVVWSSPLRPPDQSLEKYGCCLQIRKTALGNEDVSAWRVLSDGSVIGKM